MKKILIVICLLFAGIIVYSQSPQAFNYQAIVRNSSGEILKNQMVSLRISLLEDAMDGNIAYSETYNTTSNDIGLINLEIGNGIPISKTFSGIDWGNHTIYIQIEIDPNGGTNYQWMGVTKILSVPYALYADKSSFNSLDGHTATELDDISSSGSGSIITNTERNNFSEAYNWGDHSLEGYLKSFTETDPAFTAHLASTIGTTDTSHWNEAYSWGDHSQAGYLTSTDAETDPVFSAHLSSGITQTDTSNWSEAYSWGDHSQAGYLTSMYAEADPVFSAHLVSGITETDTSNWNEAYNWGDHALEGYLTGYSETDPQVGTIDENYLPKWNGSALVNSTIYDNGNVGIGTTTPGGLLGLQDANTYISVDGSNNLTFTDAVSGTKTLAEITDKDDADNDPTNEIQSFGVSSTGDTLYLDNGNYILVPGISDANAKPPIIISADWDGDYDLYFMYSDGSGIDTVVNTPYNESDAEWSPDGSEILFVTDRDGNSEIYVMDKYGGNFRNLTNNAASDANPCWSPDGSQIAFSTNRNGNNEIYIMDSDGSNQTRFTQSGDYDSSYPDWSPDGDWIAFSKTTSTGSIGYCKVYVVNVNDTSVYELTSNSDDNRTPNWSNDGTKIAFQSARDGNWWRDQIWIGEFVVSNGTPSFSSETNISNNSSRHAWPVWSHDDSQILHTRCPYNTWDNTIYIMDVDGTNVTQIVSTIKCAPNDWTE